MILYIPVFVVLQLCTLYTLYTKVGNWNWKSFKKICWTLSFEKFVTSSQLYVQEVKHEVVNRLIYCSYFLHAKKEYHPGLVMGQYILLFNLKVLH